MIDRDTGQTPPSAAEPAPAPPLAPAAPSAGLTPAAEPDRAVFTNAAYGVEAVVEPAGPTRPGMFRLRFRDIDEAIRISNGTAPAASSG